jgi:site-specific recombinase XerC
MLPTEISRFFDEQKTRGLSPHTLAAYREGITQYAAMRSSFSKEGLRDYVDALRAKQLRPATISLRLCSIRQLLQWLDGEGVVRDAAKLAGHCRTLMPRRKMQTPLGVPTAKQFLEMRKTEGQTGFGLVLETLAGTGLRLSALLTVGHQHLRLDGPKPHILVDAETMACKGQSASIIPITPYVAGLLKHATTTPIFKCSASYIQKRIRLTGNAHGIAGLHPHSMRHLYCSMLYFRDFDGGRRNTVYVRDAAGHSSIGITDKYLRLACMLVTSDAEWEEWAYGRSANQGEVK